MTKTPKQAHGSAKVAGKPAKRQPKPCKDCEPGVKRPTPHPGPRCATHWRAFKKAGSKRGHERMVTSTYQGMGPGDYDRLYAYQGGMCAICGPRARGLSKRLSVDHNHRTGRVRGLLCSECNQYIGRKGDNPEVGRRMMEYLADENRDILAEMRAADANA